MGMSLSCNLESLQKIDFKAVHIDVSFCTKCQHTVTSCRVKTVLVFYFCITYMCDVCNGYYACVYDKLSIISIYKGNCNVVISR